MAESYEVVFLDRHAWREQRNPERLLALTTGNVRPAISFTETEFMWECPGCGHAFYGMLGPEPVSGWENPRWRKTGPDDAPTLEPSLGCGEWHRGNCQNGHWWLRDGRLVPA